MEGEGMVGIMQGDATKALAAEKESEARLLWIKKRAEYLANTWMSNSELLKQTTKDVLDMVARNYADLENDFEFIKEVSKFTAARYTEVIECLPSLVEIDSLINLLEEIEPSDKSVWITGTKEDRMKKLRKLKSAIVALQK
jgi:hypothetical protein